MAGAGTGGGRAGGGAGGAAGDASDGRAHLEENPFFVLGVGPEAPRALIEREGQKLLSMLEVGLGGAATYATPFGARPRTPELVRWALAELRQPSRRLLAELWAEAAVPPPADAASQAQASPTHASGAGAGHENDEGWTVAPVVYGWKARPTTAVPPGVRATERAKAED